MERDNLQVFDRYLQRIFGVICGNVMGFNDCYGSHSVQKYIGVYFNGEMVLFTATMRDPK